jgi:DNA-binding CsgD family transcriptional regulator
MELNPGQHLDLPRPGLFETLSLAFNRTVWELVRRAGRGVTADDLAARASMPVTEVQAALNALVAVGLVKPAVAIGTGRRDGYKIAHERLVLAYDRDDAAQASIAQKLRSEIAAHGRSVLETARAQAALHATSTESAPEAPSVRHDHAIEVHRSVHLEPQEFVELSRRMQAVQDYLEMLERSTEGRPHACNYHITLEARALQTPVLPTAMLHVVHRRMTLGSHEKPVAGVLGAPAAGRRTTVLSTREREVAEMLARGQSCPEISSALDVSVNTVRTITKRLYAKLGVRRRAELVHWLRGPTL